MELRSVRVSILHSRGHHNHKCMIQAKVIVGQSCQGNSQMRGPPTQPNTLIPFDSTCDQGKSIFKTDSQRKNNL
ncbi:hypothetical protein BpHYR1_006439 [Brachionus plicatilis]|uniref:Uncharacterized protein n=1 Tax=Brachionus plicatilis TaxID=10195 RepID=A0A3M7SY41_BRAPC|nr:hypothetical protein BpHYR1_006439 [Brachionus plicatilis]